MKGVLSWLLPIPLCFAFLGTWLVIRKGHLDLHVYLNGLHPTWMDPLFVHGTNIADGFIVLVVALFLFMFNSRRAGGYFATSAIIASSITQVLKQIPFADVRRPKHFLNDMPGLHIPDGVELSSYFSFPSGHSTAGFVMFVCLALIFRSKPLAALFGVLAVFAAYTRVWISMHFMEDILVGAFIGATSGIVFYPLFYSERAMQRTSWNKRLFNNR